MGDLNGDDFPTHTLIMYLKGGHTLLHGVVDVEKTEKLIFETIANYYAAPVNGKPTDLIMIRLPGNRFDKPLNVVTHSLVSYTFYPIT